MRTTLLAPTLIALAACSGQAPPPAEEPPSDVAEAPPAKPVAPVQSMKAHMDGHFSHGVAARDAVMSGDLVAVQSAARWLAEHKAPAEVPESWRPHVSEMRTAAQRAADAEDLAVAGEAVASMANTCGSCHAAHRAAMDVTVPEPPAPGEGVGPHMARHQWAAVQMWMGLVGPSDGAWTKGAEGLEDEALAEVDDEALARAVHAIAPAAAEAHDGAARALVYGKLIASCAACHAEEAHQEEPGEAPVPDPAEQAL